MRTPGPPRITIFEDEGAVARALARRVAVQLITTPRLVIGLPTGRTPVRFYQELAALAQLGEVDLSEASTFNLDEFVGLTSDHPGSYRAYMQTHLFSRVNIPEHQIHFLDGSASDVDLECARYERAITDAGGIDLQILGIGTNGHIGFNEPAAELQGRTHRVALAEETRGSNAELFGGDPAAVPADALSMGVATILQARSIVLIATGATKATIVERMLRGPVTTALPASLLQLHPDVEILLDPSAGSDLKMIDNDRSGTT